MLKFGYTHLLMILGMSILCSIEGYTQIEKVYLYPNGSAYSQAVEASLSKFNVVFEKTSDFSNQEGLYILFNAANLKQEELPKNYIVYQTYDLDNTVLAYQIKQLTNNYSEILKKAVAIWDYSWKNIDSYKNFASNYYYFPANYEYVDPVILPCFLPSKAFPTYKELLTYSNQVDTEISSLIPMLFFHSYLRNPKIVIEMGVCFGYSTQAFIKTSEYCSTELIGIDFDDCAASYNCVKNGFFLRIDDRKFANYYHSSKYKSLPIDIVFIDTSHEYQHTLDELDQVISLLASNGIIMFHDANVTPLIVNGRQAWWRINNTTQLMGPLAPPNPKGVAPAIRSYFGVSFEETKYTNQEFLYNGFRWRMIHYPFCNGLTVLKRLAVA